MLKPNKIEKLYGGQIEIGFWEDRHRYSKRDETGQWSKFFLTSVTGTTSILDKSRVLMAWATRLANEHLTITKIDDLIRAKSAEEIIPIINEATGLHLVKKQEAADLGKEVHALAEQYIKSTKAQRELMISPKFLKKLDERIVNGFTAFLRWINTYKVQFIESEKLIYSKKYDYVGLLDLKAKVNGKLSLVDFKTSNGVYNEMRYQVSAYRAADEEESGDKYEESWIIKFGKEDGEFGAYRINNHKEDFKAFLGLLEVKKREKELAKKENWLTPELI